MRQTGRAYVPIAVPTVHAGIGDALRAAFAMVEGPCTPRSFAELLARID